MVDFTEKGAIYVVAGYINSSSLNDKQLGELMPSPNFLFMVGDNTMTL